LVAATLALPEGTFATEVVQPRVLADGWRLELVASEPEIVTPVAMTFDALGRLLVVESHTHFRPDDYEGPPQDRIRALVDSDGDGTLDQWSTFHEGTTFTMGLALTPEGSIVAVTRGGVYELRDTDGDGTADEQETIVHLDTDAEYPHNGLSGVCYVEPGVLYLGIGENFGRPYTMVGRRGGRLEHGAGRGGSVYAYQLAESDVPEIAPVASGFWNPFALCRAPNGELFVVDNDPDASPPCRLLHVVPGGDFGFEYQYGRNGRHPLQAWDGQLPGTLPMVCGTGEAPSAVVPYRGALWVTSWGDHTIERYRLTPRGSSFGAEKDIVVQGGTDFRPVGLAVAPDGSIYFSDWVKRDYTIHRHGRIWRLVPPDEPAVESWPSVDDMAWLDQIAVPLEYQETLATDPFARTRWAYRQSLRRDGSQSDGVEIPPGARGLCNLQARRLAGEPLTRELAEAALTHDSADVRLFAVRWITDRHLDEFRDGVARLLEGDVPNERYYVAVLAAVDWLSHPPKMTGSDIADNLLARELRNSSRPPERHAMALRLISPDHKQVTIEALQEFHASPFGPLRTEAVRTLAVKNDPTRFELLATIAGDDDENDALRADAVVGLAAAAEEHRELLESLADGGASALSREAARALRAIDPAHLPDEVKPAADDIDAWLAMLGEPGDAESGRRLFYSAAGAKCGVCHQHSGRGGLIGPELTSIGLHRTRRQLLESILRPSAEMAPRYVPWVLEMVDGKTRVGVRAPQGGDNGMETYYDSNGEPAIIPSEQIESRMPSGTSIMPEGLEKLITLDDLRDLLAFLEQAQ
jgi:hypothetical protein